MSSGGLGRGRGEATGGRDEGGEVARSQSRPGESSGAASPGGDSSERVIRGRAGYRTTELNTIPSNVRLVRPQAAPAGSRTVEVLSNFVGLQPMSAKQIYKYRIDFEPQIDSTRLRRQLFGQIKGPLFPTEVTFDGAFELRSSDQTADEVTERTVQNPVESGTIKITIRRSGEVAWNSFEMLRVYNMNMRKFLEKLGFFKVQAGAFVHPEFTQSISENNEIVIMRGYRTATNVHEENRVLVNLESVHKLMQRRNVLQIMSALRSGSNYRDVIRSQLIGKLVFTGYNHRCYRIEDVNFDKNPRSTFFCRERQAEITFLEWYQTKKGISIVEPSQPLLLVVPSSQRRGEAAAAEGQGEILLVPELCNLTGLTDQQRNDNRLKMSLIQASQVSPSDRVRQMREFINQLHANEEVKSSLRGWGYNYDREPVTINARQMLAEAVGLGAASRGPIDRWPKADQKTGGFESELMRANALAVTPSIRRLAIYIARPDFREENRIVSTLRNGFQRIGLNIGEHRVFQIPEGDTPHNYVTHLRTIDPSVDASIVVMNRQNKDRYDAIKKLATAERGIITQVVTARLLCDERRARGASVKIAIQLAAKVGGEPWFVNLPLKNAMICGYDTYHDTTHRGRSFGAFVASTNANFSRWFSKADSHDRLDELSAQVASNMQAALRNYREINKTYPDRVFLYRDGVSDGDLSHVYHVELAKIRECIKEAAETIKFTMIIVSKRIGARFYLKTGNSFDNVLPGTIIDDVVTRKERYDFYLVSQSTARGTVAPTYYNIIHDESGLPPHTHQAMAYKLCLLYYNWTGTVRVPAPCQYAHKLALLCGEHLHSPPNHRLSDRLHFL